MDGRSSRRRTNADCSLFTEKEKQTDFFFGLDLAQKRDGGGADPRCLDFEKEEYQHLVSPLPHQVLKTQTSATASCFEVNGRGLRPSDGGRKRGRGGNRSRILSGAGGNNNVRRFLWLFRVPVNDKTMTRPGKKSFSARMEWGALVCVSCLHALLLVCTAIIWSTSFIFIFALSEIHSST